MATDHSETSIYVRVFWWLFVLTVVEISVVFMPMAKLLINMALVILALVKASLVALYFMHLRFERRTLALVALTPLLLGVLLVFALLPDLTAAPHQSAPTPHPSATSP